MKYLQNVKYCARNIGNTVCMLLEVLKAPIPMIQNSQFNSICLV